jgi:hypothetical protein
MYFKVSTSIILAALLMLTALLAAKPAFGQKPYLPTCPCGVHIPGSCIPRC